MPDHTPFLIGIDLGGTNMQVAVVRTDAVRVGHEAAVLARGKRKTKAEQGRDVILDRLAETVFDTCAEANLDPEDILGVGIGAPGAVDHEAGVVLEAPNLRWNDVPLAELLQERLKAPVIIDNDVNVAVVGEHRMGAGFGGVHCLGVWVGTGVGGGLILNNQLHHGAFGTAGEIGHMHALPFNQPGSRSLEHNCSRTAVIDRIVRLIKSNRKSLITELAEGDYDKIKSKTVAKAYQDGDELTREVVDQAAELLGIHIGGLVTLLSLDRVVIGGGLTEALGGDLVGTVRDAARKVVFPERARAVEIVETKLLDDAGTLGAALLAQERLEK
ncbi:MAG: ROK family protein [Phycisphaerales bacterium]|nr:MAG: ROK family protein [Phycisphaerales bacterium]